MLKHVIANSLVVATFISIQHHCHQRVERVYKGSLLFLVLSLGGHEWESCLSVLVWVVSRHGMCGSTWIHRLLVIPSLHILSSLKGLVMGCVVMVHYCGCCVWCVSWLFSYALDLWFWPSLACLLVSHIILSRKVACAGVILALRVWFSGVNLEIELTVSGVTKLSFCLEALIVFGAELLRNEWLLNVVGCDLKLWLFWVKARPCLYVWCCRCWWDRKHQTSIVVVVELIGFVVLTF